MDRPIQELQYADPITAISFFDTTLCLGDSKGLLHLYDDNDTHYAFKIDQSEAARHSELQLGISALALLGVYPQYTSILASDAMSVKLCRVNNRRQRCVKEFSGFHSFGVHSLSVHRHWPVFLSADDLSIFMWNIEVSDSAHQLFRMSPLTDDLEEVLTSASFSDSDPSLVVWTSTKGLVSIGDIRLKSELNHPVAQFCHSSHNDGFLSEVIYSVSSAKFIGPNALVAREFFNLKYWDIRAQGCPTKVVPVLKSAESVGELYQSSKLYDKFSVSTSRTGDAVVTGNYTGIVVLDSAGSLLHERELGDTAWVNVAVNGQGEHIGAAAGSSAVVIGLSS
jgi:WD40 repeat protein